MIKKEILKGLLVGFISNACGIILITLVVSLVNNKAFFDTLKFYAENDVLWMLVSLGALPNLIVFFRLLNKNKEYRARGVVLATLIAAISAFILYFGYL